MSDERQHDKQRPPEATLLPGLREALLWKPNTPQLENAMTYAWESAIKSFIRAIEAAHPATPSATTVSGATPRTDAAVHRAKRCDLSERELAEGWKPLPMDMVPANLARQLERELVERNEQVAHWMREAQRWRQACQDSDEARPLAVSATRPNQTPVAWAYTDKDGVEIITRQPPDRVSNADKYTAVPLYLAAPAPETRPAGELESALSMLWHLNDHLRITPGQGVEYTGSTNDVDRFRDWLHKVDPDFQRGIKK